LAGEGFAELTGALSTELAVLKGKTLVMKTDSFCLLLDCQAV
jgi:hypothetical protein